MGGGARLIRQRALRLRGLSPRGRGSRDLHLRRHGPMRSIPAWAGEPYYGLCPWRLFGVYPRVGGGAPPVFGVRRITGGLSPRGRGSQTHKPLQGRGPGSIPAWAGEPLRIGANACSAWVYPRVGGGAATHPYCPDYEGGLSPRGRGSPETSALELSAFGSIPAWAGEPRTACRWNMRKRVYPRVGGGASGGAGAGAMYVGLSPRGRGSRHICILRCSCARSIPAWAGEPLSDANTGFTAAVYPRVGGGA